jgi:hypothetical protein
VLEVLHEGVAAAAASSLDAKSIIRWFSYGSQLEPKAQRVRPAQGNTSAELVANLKPDLFSSGSSVDLDRLVELDCRNVVVVTDRLTYARGLAAEETRGLVIGLIVLGAAVDDQLLPADEQQAQAELVAGGVSVFSIPADVGEATETDQMRNVHVDSVARFFMALVESTVAREEG